MKRQKDTPILTLSVAASLLEIHPRTLMLYEKGGLINPHRTSTKRRLFSEADLTAVQFVKYLTEKKNVNIASIKLILALLEKAKGKYPDLRKDFFPDFSEKELI